MRTWYCSFIGLNITGLLMIENGNSTRGMAEIIIAKHRNGALGTVYARFVDKYAKFIEGETELFEGPANMRSLGPREDDSSTITVESRMNKDDDTPF